MGEAEIAVLKTQLQGIKHCVQSLEVKHDAVLERFASLSQKNAVADAVVNRFWEKDWPRMESAINTLADRLEDVARSYDTLMTEHADIKEDIKELKKTQDTHRNLIWKVVLGGGGAAAVAGAVVQLVQFFAG